MYVLKQLLYLFHMFFSSFAEDTCVVEMVLLAEPCRVDIEWNGYFAIWGSRQYARVWSDCERVHKKLFRIQT